MWERLAGIAADLVERLLTVEPPGAVVNVNLPNDATADTPRAITTVAEVGYEQLFRPDGDGRFVHDFGGGMRWFSGLEGTDVEVTARGEVSISPVTPLAAAAFPAAVVDALLGESGEEQSP